VVGPLAGGKLADSNIVSWFDYATPFWAASALLVAVLAFTALAFTETSAHPGREEPTSVMRAFSSLADAVRPGRMRRLFLTNFVLYLSIFGFFRVYPMYLINRFHMTVARESLFVAWVAVPIVVANLGLVGWLARRMTARQMATRCSIVLGATMATIVIPDRQAALWLTLGVTALALAICLPAAAAIISGAVSSDEQGNALGTNQSMQVGAEALSGVLGGVLAAIATALPLSVMAALALAAAGLISREPDGRIGSR
jgi:DHA1 family tetracycline resistance protein-like MFS transporter